MKRLAIAVAALLLTLLRGIAQGQPGSISGAVTDKSSGAGLPAMVAVYSWNGALLQSVSTTAATGAYVVTGLPAGVYFARTMVSPGLNYVDEAYRSVSCVPCAGITTTTPIEVASGETVTINFPLSAGGSIAGTVTDQSSAGIGNVAVKVAASSGVFVKTAASDGSGAWVVRGLPPGTYFARTDVSSAGNYLDEAYNDIPCAPFCPPLTTTTPVSVGFGTTTGIDFALSPGGSINGIVTNAASASPVAGVTIQISDSNGVLVKEVATDAAGAYVARGLGPGTYHAQTRVPPTLNLVDEAYNDIACVPCSVKSTTPITVVGTSPTGHIDFSLSPGGSIAGTVTEDGTTTPLPGVRVSIVATLQAVKAVVTDATGGYVATGLPPGTFFAFTSVPADRNYVDESFDNRPCSGTCTLGTEITVSGAGTTVTADFALAAGGIVAGTVTDARTGAPAPDAIVDIYVLIFNRHLGYQAISVKTAATRLDGTYSVAGLQPGSYRARILRSGTHLAGTYANEITLSAGATASGIDFALYPAGDAGIVADFGPEHGLWMLGPDGHWQQVHWLSPVGMIRADVDGNHEDDLILNFGPSIGVYAWMNHDSWRFIHPGNPTRMEAADLNQDGRDDLIMVFAGQGVWRWVDTGVWVQLHARDASVIAVNGGSMIADFPGDGLWTYSLARGWSSFHPLNATTLVVQNLLDSSIAGMLSSGVNDVVAGFPGYGLWWYVDNAIWGQLHALTPALTAVGSAGLLVDFGPPYGIWRYSSGVWSRIHETSAQSIVLADRTADALDEAIIDFGEGYGLWEMRNHDVNAWSQLHILSPEGVVVGRFR